MNRLVVPWLKWIMRGRTFREQTQIRPSDHYSDNSSLVFVITCFTCKKLCLSVAQCVWVWVCVQWECVDGCHCHLSYVTEHAVIWVLSLDVMSTWGTLLSTLLSHTLPVLVWWSAPLDNISLLPQTRSERRKLIAGIAELEHNCALCSWNVWCLVK